MSYRNKCLALSLLFLLVTSTMPAFAGFRYKSPEFVGKITDTTGLFPPSRCAVWVQWRWTHSAFWQEDGTNSHMRGVRIRLKGDGSFTVPAFKKIKLVGKTWELEADASFHTSLPDDYPVGLDQYGKERSRSRQNVVGFSTSDFGGETGERFVEALTHACVMSGTAHKMHLRFKDGTSVQEFLKQDSSAYRIGLDIVRTYRSGQRNYSFSHSTGLEEIQVAQGQEGGVIASILPIGITVPGKSPRLVSVKIRVKGRAGPGVYQPLFERTLTDPTEATIAEVLSHIAVDVPERH